MLEAVVASDFHLNKLARFFPEDHLERQIVEIRKSYQYAVQNGIKYVFIPGDISDTPNMDEKAFMAFVGLLLEYDEVIESVYVPGNHDYEDIKKTSMDLLSMLVEEGLFKNFKLYMKPTQRVIGGVVTNFLPWAKHIESIPNKRPCLNLTHIERAGALMDNGRKSFLKTDHEFKCDPRDFTISGHLHTYQYMKKARTLWPGAITQVKFDDTPEKGFIHVKALYKDGELKVKHKFVPSHPNFTLKRILIEKESDWSTIENDAHGIYEVRLGDGVIAPSGIRNTCPNIFSIIGSKLQPEDAHDDVASQKQLPTFSMTTGLKTFLKSQGIKKKDRLLGLQLVKDELNRLGLR